MKQTGLSPAANEQIRLILKSELTRRFQSNPKYSLRAFAKNTGIDQSLLTKILKGNRALSFDMAVRLGQSAGLTLPQIQSLLSTKAKSETASYSPLAENEFMVIAGWHHFAILELMQTKSFKADATWIAKRLGIAVSDVNFAVERLEQCGFIKKQTKTKWVCTAPNNSWVDHKHSSLARRSLQKALLEKALVALDTVELDSRENTSLTIAIDKKLLPEIKRRIEKFKDEINNFAMSHGNANEVYQACIAFYPLTQSEEK